MQSMAEVLKIDEVDVSKYLEKLNINSDEVKKQWGDSGSKAGTLIWRIEKFKVVPWPQDQYGKFYDGDSYIVLRSVKCGEGLKHDIHFWLGRYTTQDEAGTAAYKTVELDNYLGTYPNEHREVQGYESKLFLSYFKNFFIMNGGIDSGFNIVKPAEYKPQLFHIKSSGKTLTCVSVPLSYKSLNSGDVFILDQGLKIYQWNGKKSSGIERHKAMELAASVKSERSGRPVVTVFEQGDADATPFWDGIGGSGPVSDEDSGDYVENIPVGEKILFRVSDASGKMEFKEEARNNLTLSMLDTDDIFILDVQAEVFIWIGHKSNDNEKLNSFKFASDYIKENNRPPTVHITRITEGYEGMEFKSFFN